MDASKAKIAIIYSFFLTIALRLNTSRTWNIKYQIKNDIKKDALSRLVNLIIKIITTRIRTNLATRPDINTRVKFSWVRACARYIDRKPLPT
jgi:hypothetical protein